MAACNTWLGRNLTAKPRCLTCQRPTRKVEGRGYRCVKWRKDAGQEAARQREQPAEGLGVRQEVRGA